MRESLCLLISLSITVSARSQNLELIIQPGHADLIRSVAFSPDGQYLVSASHDHTLKLWQTSTGQLLRTLIVHTDWVSSVAFSPDGQTIVSGSHDQTLNLWQATTGKLMQTFKGHQGRVNSVSFSPNGRSIISGSDDGLIKIWQPGNSKETVSMIAFDSSDYVVQLPSLYYKSSPNATKQLYFATADMRTISFEQLDIKFDRPDKVLQALYSNDTGLIKAYYQAYKKRIEFLKTDTTFFPNGFSVPQADFIDRNQISFEQLTDRLTLHITAKDSVNLLERFNVWNNEVPLFGSRGLSLKWKKTHNLDTTITIQLTQETRECSMKCVILSDRGMTSDTAFKQNRQLLER